MTSVKCSGLRAHWVNGWLAAAGATVLAEAMRLGWTDEPTPAAVLSCDDGDPVERLVAAWPSREELEDLPVAETWRGHVGLKRQVPCAVFRERARLARSHQASWALSSTLTDLAVDPKTENVRHAPFDPSGPGTVKWLHHRLMKAHAHLDRPSEQVRASLRGMGMRVADNGLGFDLARVGSLADGAGKLTDPVVEVLAFFALALLPVRGAGRAGLEPAVQRGWVEVPRPSGTSQGPGGDRTTFVWPAWKQALDDSGIDALLDSWLSGHDRRDWKAGWPLLGVHSAWRTHRYQNRGSNDPTRAFGSERL